MSSLRSFLFPVCNPLLLPTYGFQRGTGRKYVINVGGSIQNKPTMHSKPNSDCITLNAPCITTLCVIEGGITPVLTVKVRCVFRRSQGDLSEIVPAVKLPSCDLTQYLTSSSLKASHLFLTHASLLLNLHPFSFFSPSVHLPLFYWHALSTCHTFDHLTDGGIKDKGGR